MSDHTLTTNVDSPIYSIHLVVRHDTPIRIHTSLYQGRLGAVLQIGENHGEVSVQAYDSARDTHDGLDCLENFFTRCLDAVYDTRGRLAGVTDCPVCEGSGRVQPGIDPQVEVPCVRCHGNGEIPIASLAHGEHPGGDAA